jgi:DNA-binding MarR family transcriptional regulator
VLAREISGFRLMSRSTPIICSSVNLTRFICPSFDGRYRTCGPLAFAGTSFNASPSEWQPGSSRAPRSRKTKAFKNESEAKRFAKSMLSEGFEVTAGTLNPHLPKCLIGVSETIRGCFAGFDLPRKLLLLLDRNPGRNQTEIANTLGILRPNFVAMLDGLESRDLCARMRSTNDRRSHILVLTEKGRAVLVRAKKLVAAKHEARLNELLGPVNRAALLGMLDKIAREF